jgi:hypothetical protein
MDLKFAAPGEIFTTVFGDEGWYSVAIALKALLVVHVKINKQIRRHSVILL